LWASEEWATGKEWDGIGCMLMARLINKLYIRDRIVKTELWSPVDGIYQGLPWKYTGVIGSDQPWSGHYSVWPGVWAIAHTTQFAEPGWQYLDKGCGLFSDSTWKGSYVTLKNPETQDWSMIICTDSVTHIKVLPVNGIKTGPVYVWHSDANEQFICVDTIHVSNSGFSYTLKKSSIYSLTTTTGQNKGSKVIPAVKPFPFPYRENYETYKPGDIPKYHSDQKGSFEIFNQPGHGLCLRQIVPQQGYLWYGNGDSISPYTVFGDQGWKDYSICADVFIDGGDVEIGGRFEDQNQLTYGLVLDDKGTWKLHFKKDVLASGEVKGFDKLKWYQMRMDMKGEEITVFINGKKIATVKNKSRENGMAFLSSSYNLNCFDNILISPVGKTPKTL
jgi:galactosylceramidase